MPSHYLMFYIYFKEIWFLFWSNSQLYFVLIQRSKFILHNKLTTAADDQLATSTTTSNSHRFSVLHVCAKSGTIQLHALAYRKFCRNNTTMYDFHDSTDTLKFWTEKWAINKTFLFFIWFWWNLVIHVYYIFAKFHQNRMKNKKVLLIARFSVHNFKVSEELWKSYIVPCSHSIFKIQ